MQKLKISGGKKLVGEINISGAKNAALPILAASLLSEKNISLNNVPQLNDIATMITLLQSMGVEVIFDDRMRLNLNCLLYTSPSPRDGLLSRMPSSA